MIRLLTETLKQRPADGFSPVDHPVTDHVMDDFNRIVQQLAVFMRCFDRLISGFIFA